MKNNSNVVTSLVNKNFEDGFWKIGNGTDDSGKLKDGGDYYYHDYVHETSDNRYIEMEVRYLRHIDSEEEFIITVTSNGSYPSNSVHVSNSISGTGQVFNGILGFKQAKNHVRQLING